LIPLHWINSYLAASGLLLVAALFLRGLRRLPLRLSQRQFLLTSYVLLAAAVLVPFVGLPADRAATGPHIVEVWAAKSAHAEGVSRAAPRAVFLSLARGGAALSGVSLARVVGGLFALGLVMMLIKAGREIRILAATLSNAHSLRGSGLLGRRRLRHRVQVLVSDRVRVPFSFWLPGCSLVVVPEELIFQPRHLRMALRHEAQHHRQGDTRTVWVCQAVRALFYWNPAARNLIRQILELQEFACDEAIVARSQSCTDDYCGCLVWVAQTALETRPGVISIAMAGRNPKLLARRIEVLQERSFRVCNSWVGRSTAVLGLALLTSVSLAFNAPVADRRIEWSDAQHMVDIARRTSEFPLTLNDRVLEQLNLLLGTPDGRAELQDSLLRMRRYQSGINQQLRHAGLPAELNAVPVVESGYRNLPAIRGGMQGAGLWMFIESTARRVGLRIDHGRDERLGIQQETTAAVNLLGDLHKHFNDWNLALLAYNVGERQVEAGIRTTGVRDVWRLIEAGAENDRDYLARVVAVMVILKNPAVLA
jgi:beta-lactamase regulating signal transducer with metallopeptidase domain